MAKKSELEAAYHLCGDLSHRAARAVAVHDYAGALALAARCLPALGNVLRYQRRFLKSDTIALPPADLILKYAPPLFARKPLAALADWVSGLTRVERSAVPNLGDRLTAANARIASAVRLWAELGDGPRNEDDVATVKVWIDAGLVVADRGGPKRYRKVTDLSRVVVGKCPGCGGMHRAAAVSLLDPTDCPSCARQVSFVFVQRAGVRL